MRSKLQFKLFFGVILLLFSSCKSEENVENMDIPIGHWTAERMYSTNVHTSETHDGSFYWDYIITEDSIAILTYPYLYYSISKIDTTTDSLTYFWWDWHHFSCYATDSTLSLVRNRTLANDEFKDSLVFTRTNFDMEVISELRKIGFSQSLIEKNDWQFNEEQTKNVFWPEYDTAFYLPPQLITFHPDSNYFVGNNQVRYRNDRFFISSFAENGLRLAHIVNQDTILLAYEPKR